MKRIRKLSSKQAFSLVEVMVTLLIIGLISSFVYINFMGATDEAKIQTAKTQMKIYKSALDMYKLDNGDYPTTAQGLRALVQKPTTEPVPKNFRPNGYLNTDTVKKDPWNNPYVYEYPDPDNPSSYVLKSLGSDGKEGGQGTAKDIHAD